MSNNGGLQPIGGGLRPIGGGNPVTPPTSPAAPATPATPATPSAPAAPGLNTVGKMPGIGGMPGMGGIGAIGGGAPAAPAAAPAAPIAPIAPLMPPPALRPAAPPTPPGGAPSAPPSYIPGTNASASVYVPPRAADAEVWQEPGLPMGKIWACIGGGVLFALLLGAYFAFRPAPPGSVPTGYTPFTSGDKLWGFDSPNGWSLTASGAATGDDKAVGLNDVMCTSGSAKIDISISTVAGLIKNQLLFGNDITPEAMGGSHSNAIQDATRKPFKKNFKNYQEKELHEKLQWSMGEQTIKGGTFGGLTIPDVKMEPDVRLAEYTASSNSWGLGGPVHGYRATLGGETLIAYVVCQSSERDWPKLKPSFLKMLSTVHETERAIKTVPSSPSTGPGNIMAPIGGL